MLRALCVAASVTPRRLTDGPDDERKVGWDPEWVVVGDHGQVCSQLLEVDVLGTTALKGLVKHLQRKEKATGFKRQL